MDEFSFIEAIKQKQYKQASLQRGIGDDAAVFRENSSDLVAAVDTFVEGVHFTEKTVNPFKLGYRALAANFSDLAAMGAKPVYYLVSIAVPSAWQKTKVFDIFNGMKHLANTYNADLIGGDTVSGQELVLSVTVIGQVETEKARYRSTAKIDDIVFVTGTLGDSQAGLYLLQESFNIKDREYFIKRHQMPTPRIEFARELIDVDRLTLNDVSDGIGNETHEIATESDVSIVIYDELIPEHASLKKFPKELQENWKLFGGEDFELVGTVSERDWQSVEKAAKTINIQVTQIGRVLHKDEHAVYLERRNKRVALSKSGYTHLK